MNLKTQKSGDDSTNIQAETVNINHGITYVEARQIALDVFDANFFKLSEKAVDVAKERAQQITDKFLRELALKNQDISLIAQDPDFQSSLYTVQKEYAKTGDKDLGDLLVDLLLDRTKLDTRSILQIVVNESLIVAPKLTQQQVDTLSIVFMSKYTINNGLNSLLSLKEYFEKFFKPYINSLSKSNACYQHLEYSGCGSISVMSSDIKSIIKSNYGGLFSKGFSHDKLAEKSIDLPKYQMLFTRCLHDAGKIQVNSISKEVLAEKIKEYHVDEGIAGATNELYDSSLMSDDEIEAYIVLLCEDMKLLFDVWQNSSLNNFQLTSVGIAIGHANIKKNLGEFTNLSIWIN